MSGLALRLRRPIEQAAVFRLDAHIERISDGIAGIGSLARHYDERALTLSFDADAPALPPYFASISRAREHSGAADEAK